MSYQILVSNNSNFKRGEIIRVFSGDHKFTRNESLQEHIKAGGKFEDWHRTFSIVKGLDRTKEEAMFLMDWTDKGERKYYFIEPVREASEWQDLYFDGITERPHDIIMQHVGVRE